MVVHEISVELPWFMVEDNAPPTVKFVIEQEYVGLVFSTQTEPFHDVPLVQYDVTVEVAN